MNQIQGSSIPDRVESHGYSPFKVGHHLILPVNIPGTEDHQDFPRWTSSRTRLSGLSPGLTTWSTGAGLAIFEAHNTFLVPRFVALSNIFSPPEKALCGL